MVEAEQCQKRDATHSSVQTEEQPGTPRRKSRRVQSCAEEGEGSKLLVRGLALTAKVPLFASLEAPEHPLLVAAFKNYSCEPGQVIVQQGDPGRQLIIIDGGRAALKVAGLSKHWASPMTVQVGVLNSGDSMGEACLLHGKPWNVTVEALTVLQVWKLELADFERLGLRHKLRMKKRMEAHRQRGFSRSNINLDAADLDVPEKTPAERALLRGALLADIVLGPLARHFSELELDKIMSRARRQHVKKGTEVVKQGEVNVDRFYIIEQGSIVRFSKAAPGIASFTEELGPGKSFGERALLHREPCRWTARADSDATLWQLQRQDLKGIERLQLMRKLEDSAALLTRVELLKSAPKAELEQLADALKEVVFYKGERLIRQDEIGRSLVIIYEGEVDVEVRKESGLEVSRLVADPETSKAEIFGEQALLSDLAWPSSVIAAGERVIALVLDRDVFLHVMRPGEAAQLSACLTCEAPRDSRETEKVRLYRRDELKEVALIGCGRFARVSLVRSDEDGATYALKSLSKSVIVEKKQVQNVLQEKLILKTTCSPFLIRLVATFNSGQTLEFLLEAALGGDLLTTYERHEDFWGSAQHARFYAACVLRGLQHLHERHVIYRDLKMENVMLHPSGYVKLTDFGLSKFVIGHTYTKCGTPDYMAPEIINGGGHTSAVDWWSLGVLIYALMEGSLPFDSSQPSLIFWKVQCGIEHAQFSDASSTWVDLVRSLCKQDPRERLPVRAGGDGICKHAWFTESSFDWAALDSRNAPAPHKPTVKGHLDLQNFEANPADAPKESSPYTDPGDGWDADFEDLLGPRCLDLSSE